MFEKPTGPSIKESFLLLPKSITASINFSETSISSTTSYHPNLTLFLFCSLTSIQLTIAAILPTILSFYKLKNIQLQHFKNRVFVLSIMFSSSLEIGGTQYLESLYNENGKFTKSLYSFKSFRCFYNYHLLFFLLTFLINLLSLLSNLLLILSCFFINLYSFFKFLFSLFRSFLSSFILFLLTGNLS